MSHGRHLHPNSSPTRGVILLICPVSLQPFLATHLGPVPSRPFRFSLWFILHFRAALWLWSNPFPPSPCPLIRVLPYPVPAVNASAPLSLLSFLGDTHCLTAFYFLSHECMHIPPSASGKSIPRSFPLVSSRPDIACLHWPGR